MLIPLQEILRYSSGKALVRDSVPTQNFKIRPGNGTQLREQCIWVSEIENCLEKDFCVLIKSSFRKGWKESRGFGKQNLRNFRNLCCDVTSHQLSRSIRLCLAA
jgi:hypothetical protein